MTWINLSSVSVANGSTTVTINSGLTTNVKVGDALLIGNEAPVEISGVFATQLILRSNWPNPTATNAAAAVMPTSGEFTTATQALREATNVTQGNFAEMEKWWTELGTVTFKAYDNSEHEVRTAKQMDADVQATQDNMVANIEANMVAKIGDVSSENIDWDVEVDFVSGLVMKRGFGVESNGNNIVEFTRSTAREYINRSGVHQTAAVDKPAFSKAGISLYESMTNILLWSEDFSNAVWNKTNISVSQDGTLSSDGVTQAWLVEDTDAATKNSILQNPATDTDSQFVISVDIKRADSAQISVAYTSTQESFKTVGFNFDTEMLSGNLAAYTRVEKLANGWYRLHATSALSSGGAISSVRIYPVDSNLDAALGSVYVSKAQVAYKTIRCLPYQKTEGASATTESESASIPMMGNMPAQGLPFTVRFDIPSRTNREGSPTGTPFRNNVSATAAKFYVSFGIPNNIYFNLGDGPSTNAPLVDSAMRVVLVFDGTNSTIYVNGVQGIPQQTNVNYNLNTDITFHPTHNSELKNFRIVHRALTANEVKALGAAK